MRLLSLTFAASAVAKDVMLMNRMAPQPPRSTPLTRDGTGEHKLHGSAGFEYHATYSYDGKCIVFTSEKDGYGQADLCRIHPNGTGLEWLTDDPALDDQGVLSLDDSQVAFVSTRETYRANIWILI
jgi:Tol biopolymer transport system component